MKKGVYGSETAMYRVSRLLSASPLASLGVSCSNFAKKNERLLTVYYML